MQDKNTCAKTWAENVAGGGLYVKGGVYGTLRYLYSLYCLVPVGMEDHNTLSYLFTLWHIMRLDLHKAVLKVSFQWQ